jgi:hypothetical protein
MSTVLLFLQRVHQTVHTLTSKKYSEPKVIKLYSKPLKLKISAEPNTERYASNFRLK